MSAARECTARDRQEESIEKMFATKECTARDRQEESIEKMSMAKENPDRNGHKQRLYEYGFTVMGGMSRRTKQRLLKQYSEEEILSFSEKELKHLLDEREWAHYCRNKTVFNIEETEQQQQELFRKKIHFIYWRDLRFPCRLRQIEDYPLGLFYRGRLPMAERTLAIVGSRTPTAYGREMASYFAGELSGNGIGIVSGLAYGIDVAAHRGALKKGGLTFGILGCGPDIAYPKENFSIYEEMIQRGGILSEYCPGTVPAAFRFPERNRLISGLADGVLVVEARERSGSLITADQALEQGKDVFALPGRATDVLSEGTNWLIREGARLVTEPSQILEELFHLCCKTPKNFFTGEKSLDKREKVVYDCLSLDPKSIEEIINRTNYTVSEVISILFRLELNGYVKQIVKDYYIKTIQ